MTTLTLVLPQVRPTAATEFDYVVSSDGRTVAEQGSAPLALLPSADQLVLVVPALAISWHRVRVPPVGAARMRAALEGLLEERLLDDAAQLALAVVPGRLSDGDTLVAAFDRDWLRAVLAFFELAGRPAGRVVPEVAPDALVEGRTQLIVTGSIHDARILMCRRDGVCSLPLASAQAMLGDWQSAQDDATVLSDPAVASLAEQQLGCRVVLQPAAQRRLDASRCEWDLAQFELSNSGRDRMARRWLQRGHAFRHAPAWRATRWGLASLLLANLIGLNAWAWKLDNTVRERQGAVNQLLVQTFPGVRTVVDAPLQMQRELDLLRRSSGSLGAEDLEAMLTALGVSLPDGVYASAMEYASGELLVKGLALQPAQMDMVRDSLQGRGYVMRVDGERLIVRAVAGRS